MAHDQRPGKQLAPFTGMDGNRNYRAMYRTVCNFHEKYNPQKWQGFSATNDADPEYTYWEHVTDEVRAIAIQFDNDPFIGGLLLAVWDELEREYQQMKSNYQPFTAEEAQSLEDSNLQEAINKMFPT